MALFALTWWECLLGRESVDRGANPAETGVEGRVTLFDGRVSGSGRDDELNRDSRESISKCAWCRGSTDVFGRSLLEFPVEGFVTIEGGTFFELPGGGASVWLPLRALSSRRFDFDFTGMVCDLAGFTFSDAVSDMRSPVCCGFRACATARGPAHEGSVGTAMLASTKLDSTVTGKVFSRIFPWRTVSDRPKTMCWTLL